MKTIALATTIALSAGLALSTAARAATFDIGWTNLAAGDFSASADAISRTVGGVTVSAQGFTATLPSGGSDAGLTGPLPAIDVAACTNLNPALCEGGRADGLRLSRAGLGIRQSDNTAVGLNGANTADGTVTDFIIFSFSQQVDIGSVVVDDVSNFSRSIWYGSGMSADLSGGLSGLLDGLDFGNSADDATDGVYSHAVNLSGITTLVVGAPFRTDNPFGIATGRSNFYVAGFGEVDLTKTDPDPDPDTSVVPLPATGLLLIAALGALGRRRAR